MAQNISSLTYQAISPQSNASIATITLDPNVDLVWNVKLLGNVQDGSRNVKPKFISVNNIKGSVGITTQLGYFGYTTPAYTRETTISIPDGAQQCTFTFDPGATLPITVYISEERIADTINDQLKIQQTAAQTLVYAFVTITATQNQQLNSGNTQINFVPIVGAINYNLADIASGPILNGFLQFVQNTGSFPVTIVPFGAQTINGSPNANLVGWNAGRPLVLNPGDSGILTSDGTNWFYRGSVSFVSAGIALANNMTTLITHNLSKRPQSELWWRCIVADNGYAVGDEMLCMLGDGSGAGTLTQSLGLILPTPTTITIKSWNNFVGSGIALMNKATGNNTAITIASWNLFVRLNVDV